MKKQSIYGMFVMLFMIAFTVGSYAASVHDPTTKKAPQDYSLTISQVFTIAGECIDGGSFPVLHAVVIDAFIPMPVAQPYPVQWTIGKPTGQIEEHYLCKRSLQLLQYNRMKNSK